MIHNSTKLTWKRNNNHIDSIDNIKRVLSKGHDPQHSHNEEIWAAGNSSPEFRPNDSQPQPVSVSKRRLAVVKWQEQCPYQLDLETPNISMSPINPARKKPLWSPDVQFLCLSLYFMAPWPRSRHAWLPSPSL